MVRQRPRLRVEPLHRNGIRRLFRLNLTFLNFDSASHLISLVFSIHYSFASEISSESHRDGAFYFSVISYVFGDFRSNR
jgi:hypothetical protein